MEFKYAKFQLDQMKTVGSGGNLDIKPLSPFIDDIYIDMANDFLVSHFQKFDRKMVSHFVLFYSYKNKTKRVISHLESLHIL